MVDPTASTTAALALGDALAIALLDARGFKAEDFARSHPGGALGRRLLTHVSDVMRAGDAVPRVQEDTPLSQASLLKPVLFVPRSMPALDLLIRMQTTRTHLALVIDEYGGVAGLVTDGVTRDIAGVLGTDLPVWCQGAAAPPSVAGLTFVAWQQPIGCGGVAVFPLWFIQAVGVILLPAAIVGCFQAIANAERLLPTSRTHWFAPADHDLHAQHPDRLARHLIDAIDDGFFA